MLLARLRRCAAVDKQVFDICLEAFQWSQENWLGDALDLHKDIAHLMETSGENGMHEGLTLTDMVRNVHEMCDRVESLGERLEDAKKRKRGLVRQYRALETELISTALEQSVDSGGGRHSTDSGSHNASEVPLEELRLSTVEQIIAAKEQEQEIHDEHRWDIMRQGGDGPVFPCTLCELLNLPDPVPQSPLPPARIQSPNPPTSPVAPPHGSYVL